MKKLLRKKHLKNSLWIPYTGKDTMKRNLPKLRCFIGGQFQGNDIIVTTTIIKMNEYSVCISCTTKSDENTDVLMIIGLVKQIGN
jgi:hypothetical protein